jgi:hypothetical protein
MCTTVGLIAGSSFGWWMGSGFGLMTAMVLSSIGAGLGFYLAKRAIKAYLD